MFKAYTADGREKNKGQSFAPQGVVFSAGHTAQRAIGTGVTQMLFDTKDYDPFGIYNPANSRCTPKAPGYYRFTVAMRSATGVAGDTGIIALYKNGVAYKWVYNVYQAATGAMFASFTAYANGSTDYFEIYAAYSVARNTSADPSTNWFQGEMVASSVGVAPEPWHVIGAAGEPAFQNSGVAYGGYTAPAFRKLPDGTVRLRGLINLANGLPNSASSLTTGTVFTLPAGYRPAAQELLITESSGGQQRMDVLPGGQVVNNGTAIGSGGWLALTPMSFVAEA